MTATKAKRPRPRPPLEEAKGKVGGAGKGAISCRLGPWGFLGLGKEEGGEGRCEESGKGGVKVRKEGKEEK